MHPVIGQCPVCYEQLAVTKLYCGQCDTTIEGHFMLGRFATLTSDQLSFVELFVRSEGKLNRVGDVLGQSYPVIRAQLTDVIEALGYQVQEPEPEPLTSAERKAILTQLSAGELSAEEAAVLLRNP